MIRRLAVLGAGGHGRVIADAAASAWDEITFYDDIDSHELMPAEWTIGGRINDFFAQPDLHDGAVIGIGDNRVRHSLIHRLNAASIPISNVVHPAAMVSSRCTLGVGVVVFAGAVVNIGAELGDGCIINTGSTVDHDCRLGAFVHISPGANVAGGVSIGARSWIGIGAAVKERVFIGADSIVGAGAVVIRNVPDDVVVTGVPARISGTRISPEKLVDVFAIS